MFKFPKTVWSHEHGSFFDTGTRMREFKRGESTWSICAPNTDLIGWPHRVP